MQPYGIFDVFQCFFVRVALRVTALQFRTERKISVPIFFEHDTKSIRFHVVPSLPPPVLVSPFGAEPYPTKLWPPSTNSVVPVMNVLASDARNTTAGLISFGSPTRCMGIRLMIPLPPLVSQKSWFMGVSK